MPQPVLIGSTYYLRVHVPRDVLERAAGTTMSQPIGDRIYQLKLTTHAKASLRIKDWPEAKRRFSQALAALESHWEALRRGLRFLPTSRRWLSLVRSWRSSSTSSTMNPERQRCGSV
ncbi:DUF6538 domain-containing protein [Marinovum sp.]|uniref:DUF6538 domain-containing protein n=1 Tax=Marinovum sp. TaxID=2024839 RepID=UPI003A950B70